MGSADDHGGGRHNSGRVPPEPLAEGRRAEANGVSALVAGCDQRAVMQRMLDAGIATRRGIMCAHREPACRDVALRFALPASEHAQDRHLLLPLFAGLGEDQQAQVAHALRDACAPA